MTKQVYWTVLPERAILERSFICFMRIAERAGQLDYHYIPLNKMRTDIARENATAEFLKLSENPDDTLVMLDADHHHPTNIIETLVNDDKPVVSAMAFRSNPECPSPCFWLRDEAGNLFTPRTWEKGLIQVAVTGSGAIAIKRSVFTQLQDAGYDRMFWFYQYPEDGTRVSDEVAFSQMCEAKKIPVFVDATIVTPHYFPGEIDESSWEQWLSEHPEPVKCEHKVSVVIPQRGRIGQFKKCIESLVETAASVEIIAVVDSDDAESMWFISDSTRTVFPQLKFVVLNGGLNPIEKWNLGVRETSGDIIMLAANDVVFHKGWLENALAAMDSIGEGVVGINDTVTNGEQHSPHYLVSREWMNENNGGKLCCPHYHAVFPDVEIADIARKQGKYIFARNAIVEHKHPMTNTATKDELHELGAYKWYDIDQKIYLERKASGFPVNW